MMEIPTGLPPETVPLSWLLGVWEGTGVIEYDVAGQTRLHPFRQRLSFSHDGLPYLNYAAQMWVEDGTGDSPEVRALTAETGFWRLARPHTEADVGPGYLPPTAAPAYPDAEAVETLRNAEGAFDIEVSIVHPTGVTELYLGNVRGPRIELATDAVVRTASAKPYTGATRMYGLVGGELLWAWDIAALGQSLATHASARLAKVD